MRRLLAALYGFGVAARNSAYDSGFLHGAKLPVPVVSVGNLTVGGSGKTPLVEGIVRLLRARGRRPAVVTRGYGRKTQGTFVVSDGTDRIASAADGGDEPVQIARKFPGTVVIADERRARGARLAVERYAADAIVLDDAYQHRGCARDLDILVIDASRDFFSDTLLPAGRLREPLANIRRAQVIVLTRCGRTERCGSMAAALGEQSGTPVFRSRFVARSLRAVGNDHILPLDTLNGVPVVSFCGIGNPRSFRDTLNELGITVSCSREFPDHFPYGDAECAALVADLREFGAKAFVTTEKDSVRLGARSGALGGVDILYPEMEIEFLDDEAVFSGMLEHVITAPKRRA